MTLIIENVEEQFLSSFKGLAKSAEAKCKIQKRKLSTFEKSILKAKKDFEKEHKNGTLKIFKSAKDFRAAIENGEI